MVDYHIYLVTDEACLQGRPLLPAVEEALRGGVTLVQYRSKATDGGLMYEEALRLKVLCDRYAVPLIINDRLDVAMAVGAAGVHLGQDDLPCAVARQILGPDYLIGVSAHNPEEARAAVAAGADYLGCGAVFGSTTKSNVQALGVEGLAAIRRAVQVPLVGIGGVTLTNYAQVLATGADGAAIISGILGAQDIRHQVECFQGIYISARG